jgi:hypothetical protein
MGGAGNMQFQRSINLLDIGQALLSYSFRYRYHLLVINKGQSSPLSVSITHFSTQ